MYSKLEINYKLKRDEEKAQISGIIYGFIV